MKFPFDLSTDLRVQEALSRRYGNDVVILLQLKRSQEIAVFNSGRELCGFVAQPIWDEEGFWDKIRSLWHPPTAIEHAPTPKATLDDLELL